MMGVFRIGGRIRRGLIFASLVLSSVGADGKVFLTQQEALSLVFPAGVVVERKTAFLTAAEQQEIKKLSGSDRLPSALVTFYSGSRDGHEVGTAYFDTHVVRTQRETLMVFVDAAGSLGRIEVLSFAEPEEYLPRQTWYGQFSGRKLDDELALRRGIRALSGATLTARATTEAARRILAVHQILRRRVW